MKQCIKYLMILLLGVLLYDGAAQAAGIYFEFTDCKVLPFEVRIMHFHTQQ